MTKLLDWLSGKKTYAVVLLVVAAGVAKYFDVQIPEWVWAALAAGGLAANRAAITKAEQAAVDLKAVVEEIRYQK